MALTDDWKCFICTIYLNVLLFISIKTFVQSITTLTTTFKLIDCDASSDKYGEENQLVLKCVCVAFVKRGKTGQPVTHNNSQCCYNLIDMPMVNESTALFFLLITVDIA